MVRLIDFLKVYEIRSTLERILSNCQQSLFEKLFQIALHVMCFLSPADIARISLTCRYWRNLAEDNRLWRKKCEEVNVTAMDEPRYVALELLLSVHGSVGKGYLMKT